MLGTNAAPSDRQREDIRNLLSAPIRQVAVLTQELERLQTLADEVSKQRAELQSFIDAHRALVSPARSLPPDILRAIFMECLPAQRNATMSADEPPLLLCRICRGWRAIALRTPRLWASLHIVVPAQARVPHIAGVVGAWLARAGTVPLRISMVFSQTSHTYKGSLCDPAALVSTLVAASRRWQDIHLALPQYGAGSALATLASEDVPLLQTLELSLAQGTSQMFHARLPPSPVGQPAPLAFLESPSLRRLTIPDWDSLLQGPVSWGSLRHLSILRHAGSAAPMPEAVLAILRQCPQLETCEVPVYATAGAIPPQTRFALPHLTRLALRYERYEPATSPTALLFTHLALPSLRAFACSLPRLPDMPLAALFPPDAALERLELDILACSSAMVRAALAGMPELQELQIAGEPLDAALRERDLHFLGCLTPAAVDADADAELPVLCPRLQSLELVRFLAVSDETILRFVHARTGADPRVARLARVGATLRRPMQIDIARHPGLQRAIDEGLVLGLKYHVPVTPTYSPLEGTERW